MAFPLQLTVNSADCHPWRGKHRLSWDHFATSDNDGWYCGPLPTKPADTGHSCLQWGRKRSHCARAMVLPLRADSTVTIYCQWLLGSPHQVMRRGMQWDGTAASLGQMFIIERSWSFPFNLVFPWIAQGQDEPLFFFFSPQCFSRFTLWLTWVEVQRRNKLQPLVTNLTHSSYWNNFDCKTNDLK